MSAYFCVIPSRAVFDPELQRSRAALHVLAAIGSYSEPDGWCNPSLATLAQRFGCSRQAIGKQVKALVELGYLEVRHQYQKDGGQLANLYRIRLDADEQAANMRAAAHLFRVASDDAVAP